MSFTLATLKTAIQDYTENTETTFVNNLPLFIRAAEERILKSVQLSFFRKNVTGSITSGNKFLAMPTDWLSSFSLSIENSSNKEFLLQKDVNYLQEFHPNDSTTGVPRFYAVFDYQNFLIVMILHINQFFLIFLLFNVFISPLSFCFNQFLVILIFRIILLCLIPI